MRMKKRTLALRISIFILVFAGATFGAYILTPNRTRRVVQDTNINEETERTTALSRFITKLRGITEYHAKDEYKLSTHVDVKDLAFTWPSEGLVDNSLLLNAGVNLISKGLADIKFSAEANVNYNNECVDLGAGYINDTMYLALDSFKVKSTMKDTAQLMDKLRYYLFDPENENGLGLRLDVFEKLDEILSNFDSEELLSNVDLNTLCIDESEEPDFNKVSIYNDGLTDGFSIDVDLLLNKNTDDLMLLDLKTLEADDFSVSGKIAFTYDKNLQIYGLDDANYPVKRGEFPELINYSSWIDRTFELLNSRKFGLNFTANISEVDSGVKAPMINIDLDSNIDFSQVIDFKNISSLTSISAESLLSKLYFDAVLKLNDSQNNNLMNIQTALLNNTGYVSINDDGTNSDLRAKISVAQISNLVGKISSYINKETSADSFDLDQVFDEIINSDLVDAINNKNYEKIIKFINGIENTKDTVKISLNLSLLGFGETSKLELILNSKSNGDNSNQVVEISAKNLKISDFCMDFDLTIQNFVNSIKERIEHDNLQNKYINFDFMPDIFDQAEELINTPKSGFALNGFVYDKSEDQFGFSFHGDGQFDYLVKKGFGSIVFNAKTEKRTSEHHVDINVDNSSPDENEDNMFFAYNTKLKGKFNIRTLNDIIELIEEILSSDDPRFTKFLNPINASLTESLIGTAIKSEDYLSLLNNKIFKHISMDEASQEMTIILSKDLLGLDTDLLFNIGFIRQNNKSQIKYIAFAFNTKQKQIYFNLVINPYDESKKAKL